MRKGPESIPASWLILVLALSLTMLASFLGANLIGYGDGYRHVFALYSSLLGMAAYGLVLAVSGFPSRILPTVSAVVACRALLGLLFVLSYVTLAPLLGQQVAVIVATLCIFWRVPVEGHIIARAIGRNWYFGIAIAMVVFVGQYVFLKMLEGNS